LSEGSERGEPFLVGGSGEGVALDSGRWKGVDGMDLDCEETWVLLPLEEGGLRLASACMLDWNAFVDGAVIWIGAEFPSSSGAP
jgi:hypothetical protein